MDNRQAADELLKVARLLSGAAFRRRNIPWSGPNPVGPSISGDEAMRDGLLPEHEFLKWLRKRPELRGKGRITKQRVEEAVFPDEKHHWRDKRGTVRLIGFYKPESALKEILELGEWF